MNAKSIDLKSLTINEVLQIKSMFGLSDSEAIAIFFRGDHRENI